MFFRVGTHVHLKLLGRKTGVGAYTEKPDVRMMYIDANHRFIKNGWALCMEMGAYSGDYGTSC